MRRTPRQAATALALVLALVAGGASGLTACGDDSGSEEAFCRQVTDLPPLDAAIDDFSEADATELGRRLSSTAEAYDALRDAAPDDIRGSVDEVVDLVDAILDAVEADAEDPEKVADALRDAVLEHPGAADASTRVVAYAADRCDVQLNPMLDDEPTTTAPGASTTTTTG